MIVVERAKLKFLRSGRTLTVDIDPARYRRGRTYALGLTHRRQVCRVEIVEILEHGIRVRLATIDPPLLLAARSEYGYTHDPTKALSDEPEAVDPAELEHINRRARIQEANRRTAESELLELHERLRHLEDAYRQGNSRLEADLRVIRQRIRLLGDVVRKGPE